VFGAGLAEQGGAGGLDVAGGLADEFGVGGGEVAEGVGEVVLAVVVAGVED
jgi:hypothetical protein